MASGAGTAASFSISDSDSDPSEEVEEQQNNQSAGQDPPQRHTLNLPELRLQGPGRIRVNSDSQASLSRDEELQSRGEEEVLTPTEGEALYRRRTKSAPPVLWAAKKYGRQLRRMSDEFDSLLDKGEMKKKKMPHSQTWWSYLFSHQESEGENNHHDSHRTE
ncbi:BCL2 associated agonist of cell death b [Pholidichthys leucotaenia]